jgi:hypothetical protein
MLIFIWRETWLADPKTIDLYGQIEQGGKTAADPVRGNSPMSKAWLKKLELGDRCHLAIWPLKKGREVHVSRKKKGGKRKEAVYIIERHKNREMREMIKKRHPNNGRGLAFWRFGVFGQSTFGQMFGSNWNSILVAILENVASLCYWTKKGIQSIFN